jgi:hypothetical protein
MYPNGINFFPTGAKHAKQVVMSKAKFDPTTVGVAPRQKPAAPEPEKKPDGPAPITVTLPRGILVVDSARQKFACDYCGNKPLNSMLQIEQVLIQSCVLSRADK